MRTLKGIADDLKERGILFPLAWNGFNEDYFCCFSCIGTAVVADESSRDFSGVLMINEQLIEDMEAGKISELWAQHSAMPDENGNAADDETAVAFSNQLLEALREIGVGVNWDGDKNHRMVITATVGEDGARWIKDHYADDDEWEPF